ncbi:MAG: radical SAM protein [Candidatus Omnitrophota bacterium]
MAKIVFLQQSSFGMFGPMQISALLKKQGHSCDLLMQPREKNIVQKLIGLRPDLVAFSVVTNEFSWAAKTAAEFRRRSSAPVLFGGVHATFCPDECLALDAVDMVCVGEGEQALLEVADYFDREHTLPEGIANCWIKKDNAIVRNPVRPPTQDLDSLPWPDRDLYYARYPSLAGYPVKSFMSGSGCPYECSYCCNKGLALLYKDKGRLLRKRSVKNVIDEIVWVSARWPLRTIAFIDDEFAYDLKWLGDFCQQYKSKVNKPFYCLIRLELMDEERVKLLADAGCYVVHFGIESGSEPLREQVLHRRIGNPMIVEKAALLKKYGLKFNAYNMLNIPGETIEDGFETVEINIKIGTDYPWCSLIQPYPGTFLWAQLIRQGGSPHHVYPGDSFYNTSPILQPDTQKLKNLQKLFYLAVKVPQLGGLIRKIVSLPANPIFELIFILTFLRRHLAAERLTLLEEIRFNAQHLGLYFRRNKK